MRELIFMTLVFGAVPFILKRPVPGLFLYLAINIIRPEMLFWGGRSGSFAFKVFYGALLLGALFQFGALHWQQLRNKPMLLMLWFLGTVYLSLYVTQYPVLPKTYYHAAELAKFFGIVALIFLLLRDKTDIVRVQIILLCCFVFMAIWGIEQSFLGNERLEGLGGEAWGDSNGVAASFVMFLPVPLALEFWQKGRLRWLAFGAAGLILIVIVCTKSRAGFLGIVVSLVAYGFFARQMKKVLLAGCLIVVLALPFANEVYLGRLKTMQSSESLDKDGSAKSRFVLWEAGLMVFADNPLIGTGFLSFSEAKMKYESHFASLDEGFRAWVFRSKSKKVSHNVYVQVLSDLGLAGFVPFSLLCVGGISSGFYARRHLQNLDHKTVRNNHYRLLAAMAAGFSGFAVCIITIDAVLFPFFYWQLAFIWLLHRDLRDAHSPRERPSHAL